jgi:hypothetical protein
MFNWTEISEVHTASITALMMEAVRTSETSVHFNVTTRRDNPEDSKLNIHYNLANSVPLLCQQELHIFYSLKN